MIDNTEKLRQEQFPYSRREYFAEYNGVLGYYEALSCIENAHGNTLLDLACGDGVITEIFAKHFKRVVGVDASGKHLADAKKRLPDVEFHESLIEDLNLTEKFDNVFLLNLLEHVVDPVAILQKSASFLKDNGTLIVHVPNAHAINRKIAVLMGTLQHCEELSPYDINVVGHRRSYILQSLKEDVIKAGLKIKKTGGIFFKILSFAQMNWFLEKGLWKEGGFGWGRVGEENKDWKSLFCKACYEIGKERPEDCNLIYACIQT